MNVIFCFSSSSFWSIYSQQHWSQACFLMNKKILISFWTMKHSKSDLSLLTLKLKDMILHIHNVYLSSSRSLQNINKDFFIYSLQQLLSRFDEHLLWFMKLQILLQFQLTKQLLYERTEIDKSEKKQSDNKIT